MCKVKLVVTWTKRREGLVGVRRIRSEKLIEHQCREGYARSHEEKGVEWDGDNNVENIWQQVKRTMVASASEVCGSVRVGEKNPKSVWWKDEIKLQLGKRRLFGRGCWQLTRKRQKKDVWNCTERKRERLKSV